MTDHGRQGHSLDHHYSPAGAQIRPTKNFTRIGGNFHKWLSRVLYPKTDAARSGLASAGWRPRARASLPVSLLDIGGGVALPWASNLLAIPSAPTSDFGYSLYLFFTFSLPRFVFPGGKVLAATMRDAGVRPSAIEDTEMTKRDQR